MGRFQNKRKMLKGPPRGISGDYQDALGQAAGSRPQLGKKPAQLTNASRSSPNRNIVSQKPAKVPGAMGSIGAATVGDAGGAGGGSDPTSWLKENMPDWMRDRGLETEQAIGFIRKNPDSPLAKMFQEAMPNAMGSIGGTRATPPDRDPEITTLPAPDGGPTRATPPARVPEVTTLPKPDGGPGLVKRPAPAPEPTVTTLPAPDGGPGEAPVMRPLPMPSPVPVGAPGGGGMDAPTTTMPVGPPGEGRVVQPETPSGLPRWEGPLPGEDTMTTMPVGPPDGPPSFSRVNPVAIQGILQRIMAGRGQGGGRPIAEALGGLRA